MPRYRIVPEQSQVWIEATSSVHPIHTHTEGLEGELDAEFLADGTLDPTAAIAGRLSLPVERLRSSNPLQDRELRRRIDAKRYPSIDGDLLSVEPGSSPDRVTVTGEVTFHGVVNTYAEEMQISRVGDGTVTIAGEAVFDIRHFDLQPPKILMLKVDPLVTVRIGVVAVPARP